MLIIVYVQHTKKKLCKAAKHNNSLNLNIYIDLIVFQIYMYKWLENNSKIAYYSVSFMEPALQF